MHPIWALVPVKPPDQAKTRLAPALNATERAELARHMMRDVLGALAATPGLAGIALLTQDAGVAAAAGEFHCRVLAEDPGDGMSASLEAAAAGLAAEGAGTVVIVPADLPRLTAGDVSALLAAHREGVTVVPASADGGTNALVMTPPDAGACRFGPDSARRHVAAARLRGFAAGLLPLPGFARDIDTVDDVRWLCGQPAGGATREYLDASGICARLSRWSEAKLD